MSEINMDLPSRDQKALTLIHRLRNDSLSDFDRDEARDQLFALIQNLAYSMCHQFVHDWRGREEDLRGECDLAVMEAIRYWEPDKGPISTALWYCIRVRMRECFRNSEMISRSYHALAQAHKRKKQGAEPGQYDFVPCQSFEGSDRTEWDRTIDIPDPDADFSDQVTMTVAVNQVVNALPPHERRAVILTYGLQGHEPHTLREAADALSWSHEKVRYVLGHAKRHLHHSLSGCA